MDIIFPKKKQNLIYIFVESLEATNFSQNNGGAVKDSYIPKLEKLAQNNINFSSTNNLGGALQINGTGWTIAGMVAQTAGIPLKVLGDTSTKYGKPLPGTYTLGEILDENNYKNYLMVGSDANFGGRKDYFVNHGNYKIYDLYTAREDGIIDEDYYVWWGYEDSILFEYAKKELKEISKKDEPFNFTLLTVNSHFEEGYVEDNCKEKFKDNYANSLYCVDSMLNEFIDWIKKQDFSKNTTIIIVGDHLSMESDFYNNIDKNYERIIYNSLINSKTTTTNTNNRKFSTLDMFPTTLASLGVKIEGERLGLGTNLFSNKETIIEELGFNYVNEEIEKKSFYYDNQILKDTYYKMNEENKD